MNAMSNLMTVIKTPTAQILMEAMNATALVATQAMELSVKVVY